MQKIDMKLEEMEPVMRKVLAEGGTFSFYPRGTSMNPFLVQGRDCVVLAPLPEHLKKGDAVLYKRKDGAFVLHRIVKMENGNYTMRGDNQFINEPGIRKNQMIGVVQEVRSGDRKIRTDEKKYRIRVWVWMKTAFLRRCWRYLRKKAAD